MNPQHGILHHLVVPFVIGMMVLSAYLVFKKNPEIMSQDPFIKILTKQNLLAEAHVQNPNFAPDVFQTEPASEIKSISHKFTEVKNESFQNPILTSKPQDWLATTDSLLVREESKFSVFNLDGSLRWSFSLPKNTQFSSGKLAQLGHAVYLSATNGRTYSFDLRDGNLIWYLNSSTQIFHAPALSGTDLILFSEDTDGKSWSATVVNSFSGEIIHRLNNLEVALSGDALINDQVLFFATESGHLNAFLLASGKRAWTSEGSSSFKNGPSLVGDKIYLTNEDSLAMSFDIKSGRKTGEVELNTIVPSAFSPIPGTPYLYTTDSNGYLLAIDSKLSKRIWRYNLNTSGPSHPIKLLKLNNQSLNLLSFASQISGWSIWVPCSSTRLCIFDAKEGRMLYRIDLKGKPLGQIELLSNPTRLIVPVERNGQAQLIAFEIGTNKLGATATGSSDKTPAAPIAPTNIELPVKSNADTH